jgi:hypothetical protein
MLFGVFRQNLCRTATPDTDPLSLATLRVMRETMPA